MVEMRKKRKRSSRRASFLEVLDGDFSNKLMIPEAFIKNINGDIPNWFLLEIAGTRRGWRVDTKQDENGGFYFDYGWSDFRVGESLNVGDSLLFEFQQPLFLQVKIFKDGTEKPTGSYLESECEIQDSDRGKPSPKTPLKSEPGFSSTRPSKSNPTQLKGHKKSQGSRDWIEMETDYGEKQCEVNDTTVFETDKQCREHQKYSVRGKVFVTKQSIVGYMLTWRNVPHLYYYLTFPRAIITRKMLSDDETVILKDHEGNSWRMELRARPGGRVDLAQGWKEFLIENDVRNGDVLIFEFVSMKVIQIHIERANERSCQINCPSQRVNIREPIISDFTCEEPAVNDTVPGHNASEIEGETERVFFDDFTSSLFSVTWKQWNTTQACYLHIPKDIAIEQKLKNEDTVVLCDPDGIQWPVKIKLEPLDGRLGLAEGWIEFWGQHKISYGATLTFEFVSDHVMKVNISRTLPSTHLST